MEVKAVLMKTRDEIAAKGGDTATIDKILAGGQWDAAAPPDSKDDAVGADPLGACAQLRWARRVGSTRAVLRQY